MTEEAQKEELTSSPPPAAQQEKKKRRAQPVVIYLTVLTLVVVAMLVLSYAIQQRNSKHLDDLNETVTGIQSNYDTMISINDLQAQLSTLNAQLAQDEDQLEEYAQQVEELEAQLEEEKAKTDSMGALESLLKLEKAYYADQDMEGAQAILDAMEESGDAALLEGYTWQEEDATVTYTLGQRYHEIKEAVAAYFAALAETAAPTE